jgi:hypothetical protein
LARLKSDDYTCRTVRKRLMDGGSNPPSSTIRKKKAAGLITQRLFGLKTQPC